MKKFSLLIGLLLGLVSAVPAQEVPLWLRNSTISPDGTQIAFTYKGDIFKVSAKGGLATQLTSHKAHDTQPIWSPNGRSIAFASDREGGFDIFLVDANGGTPKRLTTHTANEYPITFKNDSTILFSAAIMQTAEYGQFPSGLFPQIYEVNVEGGRPQLYSSHTMEAINFNADGSKILYHDKKGYEDPWRKHQVSSIARDIWVYEPAKAGSYKKLTTFRGEDRDPVWAADGKSFYYLSEQNGSFNVYKRSLEADNPKQLTKFKDHPIRFLSSSKQGTLSFSYNGELYTMTENSEPQKVDVKILADKIESDQKRINFTTGAREMSVSPNGKEIAFIIRGDVFVASVEYGTTRRITNTPEQERSVSFSPDGRSLLYAAERNGKWNLYQSSLTRSEDKQFVYAREFKEEQLTDSDKASFQPEYSPDGKEIAFLEDRTALRILNLKSKEIRTVLKGEFNYSYSDGDQWFDWAPDSKWLLSKYIGVGGWNSIDAALVKADGSEVVNLTESGYTDAAPRFVQEGKAMLWFSDRAGYRSHGSWGSHMDAYIMFFDRKAYDKFKMSKEELALAEELEKNNKKKDEADDKSKKKDNKKDKKDKKDEKKEVKPLTFQLEDRKDLVLRLTPNSSSLADAYLNKKGDKLFYLASFEKGYDLWTYDLKDKSSKILAKDVGGGRIQTDSIQENILILANGQLKQIKMSDGSVKPISIQAEFDYKPEGERAYIFNHVWQQVEDKFYVTDLHKVDWPMYKKAYEAFLPHINNNFDFAEMLSELLGELNGSHTGARYGGSGSNVPTASLGAFYDETYKGDGLLIKELIKQGPLTNADLNIKAGDIITKIDGQKIEQGKDYYTLLAGKSGKNILVNYTPKGSSSEKEIWVKGINYGLQNNLLYKRWVEQRREMVDKLSNGRIGYVHIQSMASPSFREVYSELLGRSRNKEAVVVDTRHNGGGWLHDDLATLLSGKEYQRFTPRGQYIGSDPYNKWTKPSIVLMCENNYSNAHGFPWLYKELGIGKLVGAPVPGTMTAVWWESQIDNSIVFGIPQVAVQDMRGEYLENQELQPDIEVYNDPASMLEGRDLQLEKAVEDLLNGLGTK